jgi:hypothetical protein
MRRRSAAARCRRPAPHCATRPPLPATPVAIQPHPRATRPKRQRRNFPRRPPRMMTAGTPAARATAAAHSSRPNSSATRPRRRSLPWPHRSAPPMPAALSAAPPRRKSGKDSLKPYPFTSSKTPFCVDPGRPGTGCCRSVRWLVEQADGFCRRRPCQRSSGLTPQRDTPGGGLTVSPPKHIYTVILISIAI